VRADLPNPEGTLKANAFGTGKIVLRQENNAIAVPNEAVQWDGDCFVVFARDKNYFKKDAPKFFHVRKVRPGAKDENYTELLAGVLPGEVVATKGSGVLRGELLKNNLGEG
jgi:cobalt-zinc-cadmium efflux system membrane fusion protein